MQWIFDHLKDEADLLIKAPFAFAVLILFGFIIGYTVATWYLSGRLTEKDGLLARYKVALGLEKPSQGVLIELANEELQQRAFAIVTKLRAFTVGMRNETESAARGARSEQDKGERSMRILKERSDEFDRTLRADTVNIDTELRRRLGPKAVASIIGVPQSFYTASDSAPIGVTSFIGSGTGMSAGFAGTFADSIDQMARLLPLK